MLAAARIAVLTTSEAASLTERGIRQWTKAGIVTARRGTITDRKGRTLAISATAYIVTADPRLVSDTERFLDSIEPVLNINKEAARKRLQDKTKAVVAMLNAVGAGKKNLLVNETVDAKFVKSAGNIAGVKTTFAGSVNTYDVLNADKLIISVDAAKKLEEVLG